MNEVTPQQRRYATEMVRVVYDALRNPFYFRDGPGRLDRQDKCAALLYRAWEIINGRPDPYPPLHKTPAVRSVLNSAVRDTWQDIQDALIPLEKAPHDDGAVFPPDPKLAAWCAGCMVYHARGVSKCPNS